MLGKRKIRKRLKEDLAFIIPAKDRVLPEEAIVAHKRINTRNGSIVAFACLFIIVLSITILIGTPYLSNPNSINPNISSALSSDTDVSNSTTSQPEASNRIVIFADSLDYTAKVDEAIPSSNQIYISDMLKEKMEEYKGRDALFKVMVALPITEEEYENFINNIIYESDKFVDEANNINSLKEEVENYKEYIDIEEKYHSFTTAIKEREMETPDEYEALKKKYEESKPFIERVAKIYEEINKIIADSFKKYTEILKTEKISYARSIGATNIETVVATSEISQNGEYDFYMTLTEEMINKMVERGGYMFKLALPDRVEGYSRKISDSLVAIMEQANNKEEIHIAVVSVMDKNNCTAKDRGLSCNIEYNSDLNKEWYIEGEPKAEDVNQYINNILERNDVLNKRVINKKIPDVNISYYGSERTKSILRAGFEAKLTKSQIIELAEDSDIKLIYPMIVISDNYQCCDE